MHRKKKNRSECKFIGLKENRLNYKCKECNETSAQSVNGLIEKFPRSYKFCNGNLNKFVLLLRKSVYPYEYMDSWERFNETSLPPKKSFYSELNLEDISDKDCLHAQTGWDILEIGNLGEYHDCIFKLIHHCWQMFLKNLEIRVLKNMDLILLSSYLNLD